MTSPSADALATALRIQNSEESIQRVKSVVAGVLHRADPNAKIVYTSYFNHTYVPDLVIEWPSRGRGQQREVFLRSSVDPARIELDIEDHASQRPMFVHLSALDRKSGEEKMGSQEDQFRPVESAARRVGSLVTEVPAIDELSAGQSPRSRLLPPSMLRGGVGLIDEPEARSAANVIDIGFEGALDGDREKTATALEVISDVLSPSSANELTSYMETMWIASGRDPMGYPGPFHDLGSHLPPWRLQALLDVLGDIDADFWIRVGHSVDLESFVGLNLVGEQPALQVLVASALPRLSARSCRVQTLDPTGEATDNKLLWEVDSGLLSLRGYGRRAWVSLKKAWLPMHPTDVDKPPPSPEKVAARASLADVAIQSVELVGNERSVIYRSEASTNIARDEIAETFNTVLGAATVTKASARLGSKLLNIDFDDLSSSGVSASQFSVPPLIWSTWMMLSDPFTAEVDELRSILQLNEDEESTEPNEADEAVTDDGNDSTP